MRTLAEQIIFLTYLTDYNIPVIHQCLENRHSTFDNLAETAIKFDKILTESNLQSRTEKAIIKTHEAIDKLKYYGITAVTCTDKQYPTLLHDLKDKPPIIYLKGKLKKKNLAAVVGSREVSTNAIRMTASIVDKLIEHNFGIVSGLALGIDTMAHHRAIRRDAYTIAVMPNSLDKVYPSENYNLASEIEQKGGALISELIFGINRGKRSFVQRNRIQSGISQLVIPVEMGKESGTMHTIDFAMRQKRKILLLSRKSSIPLENDGVHFLIEKFSKSNPENVFIVKGINDFIKRLISINGHSGIGFQAQLF